MSRELWIVLGVVVFLLIIYIIYDQRKKIFKKRPKKTKVIEKPKEEVKPATTTDKKISFEKKNIKAVQPQIEISDIQLEEEKADYQSTVVRDRPERTMPRRRDLPRRYVAKEEIKRPSIKNQIRELSPEMKAILFGDLLKQKDEFKF